jgi:hypothetical protein
MYKVSKGKPAFVNLPDTTDWAHLTSEGADALYTSQKAKPKKA